MIRCGTAVLALICMASFAHAQGLPEPHHVQSIAIPAPDHSHARLSASVISRLLVAPYKQKLTEARTRRQQADPMFKKFSAWGPPPYDWGGSVEQREEEEANSPAPKERWVVEGTCVSACTLAIEHPEQICIAPDATFWFHGVATVPVIHIGDKIFFGRPTDKPQLSAVESAKFARHFPIPVQKWLQQTGAMTELHLDPANPANVARHRLTGAQLIAMGYRACSIQQMTKAEAEMDAQRATSDRDLEAAVEAGKRAAERQQSGR